MVTTMPRGTGIKNPRTARLWWIALALLFIGGILLWLLGVTWGAALPGLSLLGFIVRAWLDVKPQGGHVHDTGLIGRGVAEPPRITDQH
jgi:hypothetical protein